MEYTLKDYQDEAVRKVLRQFDAARGAYRSYGDTSAFALTATTGAGKTVMAAAVLEALFFGSDEYDFEGDPTATVLWFSDDRSLNEQSVARIHAAASELDNRLRIIESDFSQSQLHPGNAYFLNHQKLSKTSRLVRGAAASGPAQDRLFLPRPDLVQANFFDMLRNTVEDPDTTLYFVLDEAHKGMGTSKKAREERQTIVRRLINGSDAKVPMPIVFGISATIERFQEAMGEDPNRVMRPSVTVDSKAVQASGLLKDDIVLDIPAQAGHYDTVLLRRAVGKIRKATAEWEDYAATQGDTELVVPLLVVQMADKPTAEDTTAVISTIREHWPELEADAFAHVYGDHPDMLVGTTHIPHIAPDRVQDAHHVRVLLAKTAISTGWDCPRAEVLISYRPAQDRTHITQLLGRMMRTPLARRVPSNELLNSVDCLLPFFNRETSRSVADMLIKGQVDGDEQGQEETGRRVLFDPVTLTRNPEVDQSVWDRFIALPSVTIPKTHVKPIKRLTALAAQLSKDGIVEGAVAKTFEHLTAALNGRAVQYAQKVQLARREVLEMKVESTRYSFSTAAQTETATEVADAQAIDDAFKAAGRVLSPQLASAFVEHLVPPGDGDDEDLLEATIMTAALSQVPEVVKDIEDVADHLVRQFLSETRVARKRLTDAQRAEYDRIEGQSTRPEPTELRAPEIAQVESKERLTNGQTRDLPTRRMHLLATANGDYPVDLNAWETQVVDAEAGNPGFLGWYRNPDRATKESLAVAYKTAEGEWKALRPDFVFFSEDKAGSVRADLVDPHGHHLADALPKLRGLADFAEAHGDGFGRIESVAETGSKLRVLDLTKDYVREAVRNASSARDLYESEVASDY